MDALSLQPDSPLPDDVPTLQALVRTLLVELIDVRAKNAERAGVLAENAKLKAQLETQKTQLETQKTQLETQKTQLETQKTQLETQKTQLEELKSQLEKQKAQLDAALKHRFGHRSERKKRPPKSPEGKTPRKRHPHGRAPLPENLERRDVIFDLNETEKLCPCCGRMRQCIGGPTTEQLDMEPIHFFVRRTTKRTYACQHCDPKVVPPEQRIQTAGPPQVGPIAKGLCGPGLLAHCITAKFADHTPLHRLAGQLARSGVRLADSTLGGWMKQAAKLLKPLCDLMHERLRLSRVIHADDTGVKLRVEEADHTKKAHLWAAIGDADYPYVVFDFTADYSGAGPQQFFKGYKGYLQADALAQYEELYGPDKVKHVCCWAHARRKFVAAADGGTEQANEAVELIRKLYAIERKLPELLPPSDDPEGQQRRRQREEERRQMREKEARPVLEELHKWLTAHKPQALPKSVFGQAIGYALNNWEALVRYLEQGYLAIDNNLSERTLRVIALGRNNWGVIGSEVGGKTAAVLYSVVGTCKHLGIDPFAYLREALPGVFALGEKPTPEQLMEWLPDCWKLRRGRDSPEQPTVGR